MKFYSDKSLQFSVEKLSTVLLNTLALRCFACKELFSEDDDLLVKVESESNIRFHINCYERFLGVATLVYHKLDEFIERAKVERMQ